MSVVPPNRAMHLPAAVPPQVIAKALGGSYKDA